MAIWQFVIVLIPREWAVEANFDSSYLYESDDYETEMTWINRQPTADFKNIFSNILPPSNSWSDTLLCWGDEKESDIQVGYENDEVKNIQIRIALHTNLKPLIGRLIEVTKELNCVLFFPELRLISSATETELLESLRRSSAARFVNDPRGYLDELQNSK
jgi:hypothetical protein